MDWESASKELEKPLDKRNVQPAKQYGPKGEYIEGWYAYAEANAIFGHGNWSQDILKMECVHQGERPIGREQKPGWGVTYIATVRIRVGDTFRDGTGAGHGYDLDLGLAHESALKEAETDAAKRALRTFGWRFGLALYDKSKAHVETAPPADAPRKKTPAEAAIELLDACNDGETLDTYAKRISDRWGDDIPADVLKAEQRCRIRLAEQESHKKGKAA